MVGTIVYVSINTNNGESAEDTCVGCFFDTFADCGDVFLGNSTADNGGFKLEQLVAICIHGLEFNFTMSVLSTTTGLFCIFVFLVNRLGNGFLVSNLRSTNVSFHLEFTKQTVNDDFQMELTHTCDNGLSCFLIGMSTEGRIFFCKFCKRFTHLGLTCFGLRLNSQFDNGFREFHGLENYRMLLITNGITGSSKLEAYCCCDISGVNLIKFGSLVCMHLQDTSNTFLLILCSIQYVRTGVHGTGVNSEECKLTNERVSHNLECQCGERFFIGRMSYNFVAIQVNTLDRRDVCRSRHVLKNCIQ